MFAISYTPAYMSQNQTLLHEHEDYMVAVLLYAEICVGEGPEFSTCIAINIFSKLPTM